MSKLRQVPSIREEIEEREHQSLHPFAARSAASKGRTADEPSCPLRTDFQRDRDRILHSKAFRRLKHKTQVFIAPRGDHYRTRLTHSLEVAQVSRTIARALRLNEDLTEAIALGHDLGHPPFGHNGESVLNDVAPGDFHHELQAVRIASLLEPMNLTREVLSGMTAQVSTAEAASLEAQVVKIADRMTYLHHDVEDAIRAGLMREEDLPAELRSLLGESRHRRLDTMVIDLVKLTRQRFEDGKPEIAQSREIQQAIGALRKWMFQNIYLSDGQLEQKKKVERVIRELYNFYMERPEAISDSLPRDAQTTGEQRAVDYIAGMTDRYAIEMFNRHLLPRPYAHDDDDLTSRERFHV